jgi:hypothetical protein
VIAVIARDRRDLKDQSRDGCSHPSHFPLSKETERSFASPMTAMTGVPDTHGFRVLGWDDGDEPITAIFLPLPC